MTFLSLHGRASPSRRAQALYATARNIYRAFSQKLVTADQAKREKAQALRNYDTWERGEAIARNIPRPAQKH